MENIELKSEKTRNIIGKTPTIIIRFGNIFILIFLIVIFIISMSIKLPKIQLGEIVIQKDGKQIELYLEYVGQKITKGNKMKIYKNGRLLHQTIIPHSINDFRIKENYFWTTVQMQITPFSEQGMLFKVEDNTRLSVEIETGSESFIQYLRFK
ncbi:hypothetical protein [Sphingobacterium sp. ML3W]|uniref:hypothetical protein n=1 Tax=Sphingobacterium sp. ML3W TaxID=1538644 RepID=UPI0006906957|nr:hypothetical protein [Sphingobacterium sp. ML3W]